MQVPIATPGATSPTFPALRHAGFWIRFPAALLDFVILAIPFAVFVSFLSVGMKISNDFVDLRPGMPPSELLVRFGRTFLIVSLCFFCDYQLAIFRYSRKFIMARHRGKTAVWFVPG